MDFERSGIRGDDLARLYSVISTSIESWGELKVSARIDAASDRVTAAMRSSLWESYVSYASSASMLCQAKAFFPVSTNHALFPPQTEPATPD
jgi:hypothetical protein